MKEHRVLYSSLMEISTVLTQALPQGSTIDIVLNIELEVLDFRPSPPPTSLVNVTNHLASQNLSFFISKEGRCVCVCVYSTSSFTGLVGESDYTLLSKCKY